MKKQTFKLLGYGIENSASPFVHQKIFEHIKQQNYCSYGLLDIKPYEFDLVFSKIRNLNGVNITSPYKIQAFNKLKIKSPTAQYFGCVNTIKTLPSGELKGFCTDGFGFLKSLKTLKTETFKNVLILGFGGAGRTVLKCLENRCEKIFVAVRNIKKITKTKNSKAIFLNLNNFKKNSPLLKTNFQLIVNATTCGNSNNLNSAAIDLTKLNQVDIIFDLIYYPTKTILLKTAKQLGARTINGVAMLVWQAIASQKIWNEFDLKIDFTENLIKQTENMLERKQTNVY